MYLLKCPLPVKASFSSLQIHLQIQNAPPQDVLCFHFQNHGAVFSQTAHTVFSANSPSKAQGKTTLKLDISTGASTWLGNRGNIGFTKKHVQLLAFPGHLHPRNPTWIPPKNCLCLKGPVTFSKAHHFVYPCYFSGVYNTHTHNLGNSPNQLRNPELIGFRLQGEGFKVFLPVRCAETITPETLVGWRTCGYPSCLLSKQSRFGFG